MMNAGWSFYSTTTIANVAGKYATKAVAVSLVAASIFIAAYHIGKDIADGGLLPNCSTTPLTTLSIDNNSNKSDASREKLEFQEARRKAEGRVRSLRRLSVQEKREKMFLRLQLQKVRQMKKVLKTQVEEESEQLKNLEREKEQQEFEAQNVGVQLDEEREKRAALEKEREEMKKYAELARNEVLLLQTQLTDQWKVVGQAEEDKAKSDEAKNKAEQGRDLAEEENKELIAVVQGLRTALEAAEGTIAERDGEIHALVNTVCNLKVTSHEDQESFARRNEELSSVRQELKETKAQLQESQDHCEKMQKEVYQMVAEFKHDCDEHYHAMMDLQFLGNDYKRVQTDCSVFANGLAASECANKALHRELLAKDTEVQKLKFALPHEPKKYSEAAREVRKEVKKEVGRKKFVLGLSFSIFKKQDKEPKRSVSEDHPSTDSDSTLLDSGCSTSETSSTPSPPLSPIDPNESQQSSPIPLTGDDYLPIPLLPALSQTFDNQTPSMLAPLWHSPDHQQVPAASWSSPTTIAPRVRVLLASPPLLLQPLAVLLELQPVQPLSVLVPHKIPEDIESWEELSL